MDVSSFQYRFQNFFKRRFVRYGLPFLVMVVGGSFGLQQFAQLRYTFRKSKKITQEEAEAQGVKMVKSKSLDDEYETVKEQNLENWENIRGPRPWEDSKTIQDEQRNKTK